MKNGLRKLCLSLVLPFLICPVSHAYEVGDPIGKVLSTDIVTFIDGILVPSFNIAGRTAVVAENLNRAGLKFGVSYDDFTRCLTITDRPDSETGGRDSFHFAENVSTSPVGTAVMDVLYTDIKTVFNDTVLESFNIGGFTCIYADDLAKGYGVYEWDEVKRTVDVYRGERPYKPNVTVKESARVLGAEESIITKDETTRRWGTAKKSHLIKNDDGTYSAVEIDEHINIEMYDRSFNHLSSYAIKKELPLFGGLYVGKDFIYIAFGQENLLEDNSREVIKIVVYDKNFVKISEVSVNNCKTAIPFDASEGEMYENDRHLVLHTSRSQYADENGQRPQTQLTVIVDKASWTVSNMLGKFQHNHMSHALREFVRIDGDKIITVNYSDAAPVRGAFLQELDFSGKVLNTQVLFNAGGPSGVTATGGMTGGFEVSDSGYLVSMSSIDHSLPTGYSNIDITGISEENRDIYLLWTDKNTYEMKHTCLARYTGVSLTGSVPYLVKLTDGNFMVLWQRFDSFTNDSNTICYAFISGDGDLIGRVYTVEGKLSDSCQPIANDGKVVWYVNTAGGRTFYQIDADSSKIVSNSEISLPADSQPVEKVIDNKEKEIEEEAQKEKNNITEVDGI